MHQKYLKKKTTLQPTLFLSKFELSLREGLVFSCFAALLISLIIISIWSLLLLTIGSTSGGGPLGIMMRYALVFAAELPP